MSAEEECMVIVDGPGTAELLDALKYAYDKTHPFTVTFKFHWSSDVGVITTLPLEAKVFGVRYEAGTSGAYIIQVYARIGSVGIWENLEGFYNANMRRGALHPKTGR